MKKESILKNKIMFTIVILFIYMIGREITLYGIDVEAYRQMTLKADDILLQTVSGDVYRYSIFALGISSYMISSLIIQVITYYQRTVLNIKVSMIKVNRVTVTLTLILSVIQSFFQVQKLQFRVVEQGGYSLRAIAMLEMVTGVMIIIWISERNKKYGIGGQTVLILVNIIDSIRKTIIGESFEILKFPLLIALILIPVVLTMENAEKRIPIQRVSIHNIYADKNYLAIKLNPAGVMPIMFSTAFFMIPQLVIAILLQFFPDKQELIWWQANMNLTKPLGIAMYILILYLLTILFAIMMISPGELAEQLLKSGDSIVNLYSGKETRRYLQWSVIKLSIVSSTVMGICVGVPLLLQMNGIMDSALSMLPTTVMMLAVLESNIIIEYQAIKSFDNYKLFL